MRPLLCEIHFNVNQIILLSKKTLRLIYKLNFIDKTQGLFALVQDL